MTELSVTAGRILWLNLHNLQEITHHFVLLGYT